MYIPAAFACTDPERLTDVIRAHPLATLIVATESGPEINLVPLVHVRTAQGSFLRGHLARANPLARGETRPEAAVAVFRGDEHYISPSWYPSKHAHGKAVPTWNYELVEARGPWRLIDDRDWLRTQIEALTAQQEAGLPTPWTVNDAPADYVAAMLGAVIGIEIAVHTLRGKLKLSQNQPESNRQGIINALGAMNDSRAQAMAAAVSNAAPDPARKQPA